MELPVHTKSIKWPKNSKNTSHFKMNKHARASSNHYHYHCKQLYDNHYKNLPQSPAKQKADININKKKSVFSLS